MKKVSFLFKILKFIIYNNIKEKRKKRQIQGKIYICMQWDQEIALKGSGTFEIMRKG